MGFLNASWWLSGCRRTCSEQHTYTWGDCALAPESAKPAPTASILSVFDAADGHKSIGYDKYTAEELAALITPALREVPVQFEAKSLRELADGGVITFSDREYEALALAAAKAIIHRHDQGIQWCTRPDHACGIPGAGPCNGLPRAREEHRHSGLCCGHGYCACGKDCPKGE